MKKKLRFEEMDEDLEEGRYKSCSVDQDSIQWIIFQSSRIARS